MHIKLVDSWRDWWKWSSNRLAIVWGIIVFLLLNYSSVGFSVIAMMQGPYQFFYALGLAVIVAATAIFSRITKLNGTSSGS